MKTRMRCCEPGVKRVPWTAEEDAKLVSYIEKHGHGNWGVLPKLAGLNRCGRSCRLRWLNYLRPNVLRPGTAFSQEEEQIILELYSAIGNRWSVIASQLPGRTDNDVKNFWHTHLKKKLLQMAIDPLTHRPFPQGRTRNNGIKNFNSFSKRKESQGNRTTFESIKVATGATPSFQETEETTPNSEVEGSQSSFNFHPNKGEASAYKGAESGSSPFSDMFNSLDWQSSFGKFCCRDQDFGSQLFYPSFSSTQPDTLGNIPKQGREGELFTNRFGEQKVSDSHLLVPQELQASEDDSWYDPVSMSREQEDAFDKFLQEAMNATICAGNKTKFNNVKVAEGTTPYFQEIEETTPSSDIEGSQSSSFYPNIYRVPSPTTYRTSLNSAQASAYGDAESDSGLSWVSSTSMLSPNWASEYEDYLPDSVDPGDSGLFMGFDGYEEVGSQPFNPSLSSTQCDTLGNIPKQGREKLGELPTNSFHELKEFDSHLLVPWELQESENSSHLSNSLPYLTLRSHEQEVAGDGLLNSLKPFHEHSKKLLSTNNVSESKEFGIHLPNPGELQGTNSTQSVDVSSGSVMDYDNEFTRSEGSTSTHSVDVASESLMDSANEFTSYEGITSTHTIDFASESVMDYTNEFTTSEIFESKEALIQWTRELGKKYGFVIVIKRSDSGDGGQKARITFCCERGGRYRNTRKNKGDKKEKQSRNTKKCGCPFTLKGQKLDSDDNWKIKVVCGVHNHPTTEPLKGYSYAGRLSKEEILLLKDMSKSMKRPKDILERLKNRDVNNSSTIKHIYNARQRYKVIEMATKSKMQQLLSKLSEQKYIKWHRNFDNMDLIKDLFWAHPVSIDLLHTFPCVLFMDCTHNTNGYNVPLLEIIGVTSTKVKFSVAFAYLESEQEDNYTWALERLRSVMDDNAPSVILSDKELALMAAVEKVFPTSKHLLCRRHISKNIRTNCKNLFATNEIWEKFVVGLSLVLVSSNEDEFAKHLNTLKQEFNSYPQAIEYVMDTWLNYHKERFVSAWIDKIMHFGYLTKDRVKSLHSRLKKLLRSNQNNFETSWAGIHKLLEQQHRDIKASFEKSLTLMDDEFKHAELKELRGCISIDALQMVLSELRRANSTGIDAPNCGCTIRHTHGLPCAHEIAEFRREHRPIPLESIDLYWRKLDLVPVSKKQEAKLGCELVFDSTAKHFDEVDDDTRSHILKKMTEIANSQSTSLTESEANEEIHGRPNSKGLSILPTRVKRNKRSKGKVHGNKRLKSNAYISSFPVGLQPYIHQIRDVDADGNCGFRAIADLMGFGENGWLQVRKDLLNELNSNLEHYSLLYAADGADERVKELIHVLSYFESYPTSDRWMTMPDMGHLISSAYNVVLFFLSSQQCLTFLPLTSMPIPTDAHKDIAIGFVNNNHFVEVFLVSDHPVPPIASNWYKFHQSCANGWDTVYIPRIQQFKKIVGNDVATNETIDVDSGSCSDEPVHAVAMQLQNKLQQEILKCQAHIFKTEAPATLCSASDKTNQNPPTRSVRKCTHCKAAKTPQCRAGPLGPKTLCNACGVR